MRRFISNHIFSALAGLFFLLSGSLSVQANNVRVRGTININQLEVVGSIATVYFTLEWDNSWRDDYNHDAIYFFLKYKSVQGVWRHMYLADQGHTVSNGFEWKMANSSKVPGKNEGIFIQRANKGSGRTTITVQLKWDMTSNPLEPARIEDWSSLSWSGMGIEMVYIPRGPFYAGDNKYSEKSFRLQYMPFPAQYDVVNTGYFITSRVPVSQVNPASNAANHVNDVTNTTSNAWVGNGSVTQWWMIDFQSDANNRLISSAPKRNIKYIALAGLPGHIPGKWSLEGTDDHLVGGDNWVNLNAGTGTNADWDSTLLQTYPPRKIIKLANPGSYRYYRLSIKTMAPCTNVPVIKSIAMTEADLENVMDYSVLIDRPTTDLGNYGMYAPDSETWTGTTAAEYPNGYKGFYAMKYEISQEQYAEFLNKLPYEAQKQRTVGTALDALEVKDYVFGNSTKNPSVRNGIILADRGEADAKSVTFACNLNAADGTTSMDGDGQTIACNYLSVNDMLAYADWCGLRPLSEMEYEKMSRRPYPFRPDKGEFAWNSNEGLILPAGLSEGGFKTEKVAAGNVNGQDLLPGPVRCGIFAKEGSKQPAGGSSFWGVMELSGNLSEMYYSAGPTGRTFKGLSMHGNGELPANGATDVNASYWPQAVGAIAVRGGSFKSGKTELTTSARNMARNYFTAADQRDSTVTFRLGYTASEVSYSNILTAQNGKTTQLGMALDTICSGMDYRITGNEELQGATFFTYLWYCSENQGQTWTLMEDQDGKDLLIRNLTNTGLAANAFRYYQFKRKVITPRGDGESNIVNVAVVDDSYTVDRLRDTVTVFDETNGIRVSTKNQAVFKWTEISGGTKITPKVEDENYSYIHPKRAMFIKEDDKNLYGEKIVELNIRIGKVCSHTETIELVFPDAVNTKVIGIVTDASGARMWADGSYARSADEYRNANANQPDISDVVYRYTGATGNGIYWIDPDGGGPIAAFRVYCDMETDGHGWMLAGKFSNNDANWWCTAKNNWTDVALKGDCTNATTFVDEKSAVWGNSKVDYMMFQTMRVPSKAFCTDGTTLQAVAGADRKITLSEFFTTMLKGFPNTTAGKINCEATMKVKMINSRATDFPWINGSGFSAGYIAIAKYDEGDSQGVISGYASEEREADLGLGSLEDPSFGSGGQRSDVGVGGSDGANNHNVLLFVR